MKAIVEKKLSTWNYEEAVAELQPKIIDWAKRTLEVARALYIAREALSNPGYRADLTSFQMERGSIQIVTIHTFEDFCNEVGIPKTTAWRWIKCYDPDKDYLYEAKEVADLLKEEKHQLFETVEKKSKKLDGWRPELVSFKWDRRVTKWDERLESEYQVWRYEQGYLAIDPTLPVLNNPPIIDKFGQYGLWSTDYLDSLITKCAEETSGLKATGYYQMVQKYQPKIPKSVPEREIMRLPVIVKAALSNLPKEVRAESASLVAEIISDLAEEL